jgi:hypothetical protein
MQSIFRGGCACAEVTASAAAIKITRSSGIVNCRAFLVLAELLGGQQFQNRGQLFIRTHNETLSVVAVPVCNPDRSPVGINRCAIRQPATGVSIGFEAEMPSSRRKTWRSISGVVSDDWESGKSRTRQYVT